MGFKKWNLEKVNKNNKQFQNYINKIEKQVRIEKTSTTYSRFTS